MGRSRAGEPNPGEKSLAKGRQSVSQFPNPLFIPSPPTQHLPACASLDGENPRISRSGSYINQLNSNPKSFNSSLKLQCSSSPHQPPAPEPEEARDNPNPNQTTPHLTLTLQKTFTSQGKRKHKRIVFLNRNFLEEK
jgi:hypothetical protein